jgi:A/G-specific adenine glycosylase
MPGSSSLTLFRRRLLAWYSRHARPLPWRRTRDPYRVLVSEFMLQQTQVSRVEIFYPAFLKRFSSIEALARARPKAVREAWEGLGYYARARNLHKLAKEVSGVGCRVPDTPEELIKLPGVGRYTAGAVACFAYEKPVAAVDTNVARVIRRYYFGEGGRGKGEGSGKTRLPQVWAVASTMVPRNGKRAWKFNQAMMELGATVCIARKPRCHECPVVRDCKTGRRIGRRSDV